MSLQTRLASLTTRIATEVKALRTETGLGFQVAAKEITRTRNASAQNRSLAPFHLALAGQKSASCNIVVIGDSVFEGAVTSNPLDGRAQAVFTNALRDEPGGQGYLPAWFASPFVTNPAVFSHTPVNVVGAPANSPVVFDELATSVGPASRRIGLQKSGWAEWTFTGDQVRVWFDKTDFFALNAKVIIDGVEVTTINGIGAQEPMFSWTSALMPRGKHTVRVQEAGNNVGGFWLEAVQFLDADASKGVHTYDFAHSGASAAYFANGVNPWPDALTKVSPSLVVAMVGFNDVTQQTPAQFLTSLRGMVARIRAKLTDGTYTLALVVPWAPAPEPTAGWAAYADLIETVASEHPNGITVRLIDRWPTMTAGANNPGMFGTDTVHPNEAGQRMLGLYLADALGLPGRAAQADSQPKKQESLLVVGPGPNWFTTVGSYKIPPGATSVDIEIQGPGSGGGSGRRGAASTLRTGGGGGGSGPSTRATVLVSELPAGTTQLFYSIPSSGAGGESVTTNDTNGNPGGSPNTLTYVSLVENVSTSASLIASAYWSATSGGRGGTATTAAGGAASVGGVNAVAGGAAVATGTGASGGSSPGGAGGGAAGGSLTAANAVGNGGNGGYSGSIYPTTTGGTGGISTGNRNGSSGSIVGPIATPNGGGGGGASHATLVGGNGGAGGDFGGGGGGGGASVNGSASGAGGDGGRGYVRFIAKF